MPGQIAKKILKNPVNAGIFSSGDTVYLVGGYLRDMLLCKKTKDMDYVVSGDVLSFAKKTALLTGGRVIELKKEKMARIALPGGRTLDFTALSGSIESDLSGRDFTMNALAWSPEKGLTDPFGGISDIKNRNIRAVSEENLMEDPVRLLRAFRFAAEPGWVIDDKTRAAIRQLHSSIKQTAPERITMELFKLLNADNCVHAIQMAYDDRLLPSLFAISKKQLLENIKGLSISDSALIKVCRKLKVKPAEEFSQGLAYMGLLRLEQLLMGSSLNESRLRLSRPALKRLTILNELLADDKERRTLFSPKNIFSTFLKSRDAIYDMVILNYSTGLQRKAARFLKIMRKGLLTPDEIMSEMEIKSGPQLGKIIIELKKLQFENKLKNRKQALRWLERKNAVKCRLHI